ncbi:class I SAM-dependent methyltransferase [Glycocaulis abyssi]|uniref:Class I SAM-dependent methyltransferase n=1 Tax=Glycocaulis abyssi TaxID=1433403 RepID=A0ABV9NEP9_9PROT
MSAVAWMDRTFYPGFARNWDDILFRERILAAMPDNAEILDVGAGAGIIEMMNFRGIARRVCGVDLDPRVAANPYLDEGRVADAGAIPFEDSRFGLVFSDNVVEHLDDPATVFAEIFRVLKPGGLFLFKTPNRFHYMPLIAQATPHGFHQWINRKRGRAEADTFPTRYRANSARKVRQLAVATGFKLEQLELVEGRPEYMRLSPVTYAAGIAYERTVNLAGFLKNLRILLIATLRKPE